MAELNAANPSRNAVRNLRKKLLGLHDLYGIPENKLDGAQRIKLAQAGSVFAELQVAERKYNDWERKSSGRAPVLLTESKPPAKLALSLPQQGVGAKAVKEQSAPKPAPKPASKPAPKAVKVSPKAAPKPAPKQPTPPPVPAAVPPAQKPQSQPAPLPRPPSPPVSAEAAPAPTGESEALGKKLRNAEKRLRFLRDLKQRVEGGYVPDEAQQAKLKQEPKILAEVVQLRAHADPSSILPADQTWSCRTCTYANKLDAVVCAMCEMPRPQKKEKKVKENKAEKVKKVKKAEKAEAQQPWEKVKKVKKAEKAEAQQPWEK
eukprot:Hpha_TRINITY_DN11852_c0_g1::TRINITY_DN11852_c0_g1_i1::g.2147::m.2147